MRSAKLAIITSYPTSATGIIVLFKNEMIYEMNRTADRKSSEARILAFMNAIAKIAFITARIIASLVL